MSTTWSSYTEGGDEEHHQVVALLRRDFRRRARRNQGEVDVVDDHFGVVLLAPFLGVLVVEPLVVGGDEVAPLQDLQRLGRARGRHVKERADAGGNARGGCRLDRSRRVIAFRLYLPDIDTSSLASLCWLRFNALAAPTRRLFAHRSTVRCRRTLIRRCLRSRGDGLDSITEPAPLAHHNLSKTQALAGRSAGPAQGPTNFSARPR